MDISQRMTERRSETQPILAIPDRRIGASSDRQLCFGASLRRLLAAARWCLLVVGAALLRPQASVGESDFDAGVARILIARCLDCHSGPDPKGGLNLLMSATAFQGGESGAAIVPKNPAASVLWQRIAADEMPPKQPLDDAEKHVLRKWIESGAQWGTDPIDLYSATTATRAGYDWWALQPLRRPAVPATDSVEIRNPIDAFAWRALTKKGLTASPRAEPRELVRRLHFDLIGLPPDPAEVSAFLAMYQRSPDDALRSLTDRLLQSPHFGERWGRHWLDVVRFGESQGFERDKIRLDSWHYRDWVINAFNRDMPWDEFVRQQIAGDILYPQDPEAITATGFMVAGPWDEVGQNMRSKAMRAVVRQDEIEDYVGTIGQTFLGLTVNCARCHDHKFDPIRQSEYYQLAASVSGVRHGSRNVISAKDRELSEKIAERIQRTEDQLAELHGRIRTRLLKAQGRTPSSAASRVAPIARWDFQDDTQDRVGQLHATQHPQATVRNGRLVLDQETGYAATHKQDFDLGEKTLEAWVRLDNFEQRGGAAMSIQADSNEFDAIVFGERQPGKWMAGSDFFKRTRDLEAPAEHAAVSEFVHFAISYHADGTIACFRNGKPYGKPYRPGELQRFRAGTWHVMFGLRTGGPHPRRQLQGLLETAQLYDRALTAEQVRASCELEQTSITHDEILAKSTPAETEQRQTLTRLISELKQRQSKYTPHSVYSVVPQSAEVSYVLLRGNPANKGDVVVPGGIAAVDRAKGSFGRPANALFGLPADATDASRRRALAQWVTREQNPLFARVIVNRLWHYHFGTGIVATPNDFGFNGGRPSHPELLDWLAAELIDSGWKLRHIHRLIVTSATWLQSSRFRPECATVDADSRFLWRRNPQRLEAEALRDAILAVSGQLNRQYGGPPYRDFETFTNNTQFYTLTDPDTPEVYRRTVYRTWIRSGRNRFLDAFDCPDPSSTAPKRAVTTTPIQSLALMNNSFVLRMADRLAERVLGEAGEGTDQQVQLVFQLAYARGPAESELAELTAFIEAHGLPALCRVILNSNEFIHVD